MINILKGCNSLVGTYIVRNGRMYEIKSYNSTDGFFELFSMISSNIREVSIISLLFFKHVTKNQALSQRIVNNHTMWVEL